MLSLTRRAGEAIVFACESEVLQVTVLSDTPSHVCLGIGPMGAAPRQRSSLGLGEDIKILIAGRTVTVRHYSGGRSSRQHKFTVCAPHAVEIFRLEVYVERERARTAAPVTVDVVPQAQYPTYQGDL